MEVPIAFDLFSGSGGLTLGLKRAGFRVVGAVDNDELSTETYAHNHPEVRLWLKDIRELTTEEILRELKIDRGALDLLAGCPPCQGFSSLRTLNGPTAFDDPRNDLVLEFLRFVEELQPKAVMLENVPGLAADDRLRTLCSGLAKLKYVTKHSVLDAADYRVPQRRKRVILLAGKGSAISFPRPRRARRTVRDAIGHLPRPGKARDPLHDMKEKRDPRISSLIKLIPKDGGSRSALPKELQLDCHRRLDGFYDIYGRMSWSQTAPTITGGCVNPSKGRFLHPTQNRAITLREAALLQSFPRRYFFSLRRGKYAAAELIGNALPPEFVKHHAGMVRRWLLGRAVTRGER